jgi:23S rRNA (cytidine1920-2'-O)/16S rRNA (cytidine1409-2'-O)-methyltransferase
MPKGKVRLDRWVVSCGLVATRERARSMILAGRVRVSDRCIDKPGSWIDPGEPVTLIQPDHPYVSRGGVKLEGALRSFGIKPEGKVALDVGASTGGFTHCLLLHGASKVYAVDVGYGQFAWELRQDPRVVLYERTNIRYLERRRIGEPIDLAAADVSFISLKMVIPSVRPFLSAKAELVCLIKPQFEVGKGKVGKGGVVKDPDLHESVLRDMEGFAGAQGFEVCGIEESCLRGPMGNREFFLYLRNPAPVSAETGKSGGLLDEA